MPQDAFTLRHIAKELDISLRGGKINKINQPEKDELNLLVYANARTQKLTINANASDCGLYFLDGEKENPIVAPNFCMLLRKHIQGAEILSIEQVNFERIVAIRLWCRSDFSEAERILYVEVMGKYSNVILVSDGIILGAMKTTSIGENVKRVLFPGAAYTLPAPQDKLDPSKAGELSRLPSPPNGELGKFLFERIAGLAPVTAEQIAESFQGGDLIGHIKDFLFSDEVFPCATEKDFFARRMEGAKEYPTLLEAERAFYSRRRQKKDTEAKRRKLTSLVHASVKKHEKRLGQILQKYEECKDAETLRIKGELLTANLYALSKGMKSCELSNYYDEQGGTVKIVLDETLTPSQNAQKYYTRYQKMKRTMEALLPQEKQVREELDYLSSLLAAVGSAETGEDFLSLEEELTAAGLVRLTPTQKKKKPQEIPFRSFEKEGFKIFAGRNNLQNDRLVKSSAPTDMWLHTQKYHSSHVVIKTEGKAVPESVLLYAAELCAKYSDGGLGDKIPVDYCLIKHVKKPPKSKAGFVIYTDYKTLLVTPAKE